MGRPGRAVRPPARGRQGPRPGLSRTAVSRLRRTEPDALAARLEQCAALGVTVLTPADAAYPDRLRALPDRPLALYATGDAACLNGRHYAAVVGTRRPTRYGVEACRAIAGALAGRGRSLSAAWPTAWTAKPTAPPLRRTG